MTQPLRPFLLNEQISIEARRLAHKWTDTCKGECEPNLNDRHTKNCNALKREIEELCLQIKCASIQPPLPRQRQDEDRTLLDDVARHEEREAEMDAR